MSITSLSYARATRFDVTLEWNARAYDVYEVQSSTDLVTWTRLLSPLTPTSSTGSATIPADPVVKKFFRAERLP